MKHEESLQIAISNYLKLQYPSVIFTAESSGLKLTIGQAVKAKKMRSSSGLPDMIILSPQRGFHGLCLELKNETPFKKDGSLKSGDHLKTQNKLLHELRTHGYAANFVTGFDQAKEYIDFYFGKRLSGYPILTNKP